MRALEAVPGTVTVRLARDDDGAALVSVTDEGPGIPPEEQAKIFAAFYRTDEATAARVAGLGLGLYICRMIVERHGGRIWAESEGQGRGTTVRFTVPYEPAGHAEQGPATSSGTD